MQNLCYAQKSEMKRDFKEATQEKSLGFLYQDDRFQQRLMLVDSGNALLVHKITGEILMCETSVSRSKVITCQSYETCEVSKHLTR